MWGSRNPIKSSLSIVLILGTVAMYVWLLPERWDPFPVALSIIALAIVLLGEGMLFCHYHYNDRPADVLQRIANNE